MVVLALVAVLLVTLWVLQSGHGHGHGGAAAPRATFHPATSARAAGIAVALAPVPLAPRPPTSEPRDRERKPDPPMAAGAARSPPRRAMVANPRSTHAPGGGTGAVAAPQVTPGAEAPPRAAVPNPRATPPPTRAMVPNPRRSDSTVPPVPTHAPTPVAPAPPSQPRFAGGTLRFVKLARPPAASSDASAASDAALVDVRCGARLAREQERRNVEPDMRQYQQRMAAYLRAHESDHLADNRGGRAASDPSLRPIRTKG